MNIFNNTTKTNEIRLRTPNNLDLTTTTYHFTCPNNDFLNLPLTSVSPEITGFSSLENVHDLKMIQFSFVRIAILQVIFSSVIDVVDP